MEIKILTGKEAEEMAKEMEAHIRECKALAKKLGAKSFEGMIFEDGKVKSIDEDD
tara:strand:+ start:51 stop:215 length:165 start_codon:yes stop_codon:yes gene_type:complete